MCIRDSCLPFARLAGGFLALLELLFGPDVLRAGQFVNVEFAVEVIDLVLEDARRPVIEAQAEFAAVAILAAHANGFVPLHLADVAGDGQTCLLYTSRCV